MTVAWIIYCTLTAIAVSCAAAFTERVLIAGRAPVRIVWVGALLLSIAIPAAAFRLSSPEASRPQIASAASSLANAIDLDQPMQVDAATAGGTPVLGTSANGSTSWTQSLESLDRPFAYAWGALSLVLAINFLGGIVTLAWMRRGWQKQTVHDTAVYVSEKTGPAVVGAIAPAIVVPRWVLELESSQLSLMLQHEEEHRRARDGQLIAASRIALIVMPWNVALWWQVLRLRVAVELDCDARVLKSADARSYGDLLLNVARVGHGSALTGATAFAERATQLERRIRCLPRHRRTTSRTARAVAASVAIVVVCAAWIAPHPPAPTHGLSATLPIAQQSSQPTHGGTAAQKSLSVAPPITTPRIQDTTNSGKRVDANTSPARNTSNFLGVRFKHADTTLDVSVPTKNVASVNTNSDAMFKFLFDGIKLTPARARAARNYLQLRDPADTVVFSIGTSQALRVDVRSLTEARNAALRALLEDDVDRAMFDARIASPQSNGRGRIGGAPPDSQLFLRVDSMLQRIAGAGGRQGGGGGGGRGGRGGGAGGARGGDPGNAENAPGARSGGAGRGGRGSSPEAIAASIDATYHRLFDGMSLSQAKAKNARTIIGDMQAQLVAQQPAINQWRKVGERVPTLVRADSGSSRVIMRAPTDSLLTSLVATVADRAILRSRIVVLVPRP